MPTVKQGKNPKQYPPCNRAFALRMMHPTQYVEGRISPLDRALKPIKDSFKKSSKSKRKDKSNHQSHENSDQLSSSGFDDDSSFEVYSPTDEVDLHKDFERLNGKVKRPQQQQQQHQKHYEQQQQHYQQQQQQQQQQQKHYEQQQQHYQQQQQQQQHYEQQQQHHYHQQQIYQQQQQEEDIESQNASRYNIKYDRRSNKYYRMNNDNSYATMEDIYEEDETDDHNQQQVTENTFYKHNDNRMDTVNDSHAYHHRPPNTENQPRDNQVPWDTHNQRKDNLHHHDDDDHVMFVTSNGDTVKLRKKKSSTAQAHNPVETSSIADDIRAERFGKRLSLLCHMLAEKYPEDFHILELLVELQVSNEKREKEMNQSVSDLKDKVNSLEKRLNIIERLSLPGLQKALLPLANAFGSFYDGLKRSIDVANEQDGGCSSCENDLENPEIEDKVENKVIDGSVKTDDQLIDDEDVVDDDDDHDDDDDAKETESSRNESENCSDEQNEKENENVVDELGNNSDKILKEDEDRVRNKVEDHFKEDDFNIVSDSERVLRSSTEEKGIETEAAFERGKEEKDESDADRKSDYVIIGETEEKEPGIEQNEQKSTEISNSKTSLNTSDGEQPCNNDKDESCSTSEKISSDQSNKRLSNYKSTESLKTFPNETSV